MKTRYFNIEDNQLVSVNNSADTLWIHLEKPDLETIQEICTEYKFPPDYLTCILDDEENSRYEGVDQTTLETPVLLLLQYPHIVVSPTGYKQYETFPFSIILTKSKIITASNYPPTFFKNHFDDIYNGKITSETEDIALHLIFHMSLTYNRFLKDITAQVNQLESELQVATENKQLYQLMDIQKGLVYFNAALNDNLVVLQPLQKSKLIMNSTESQSQLHDNIVETKQALTSTKIQLQIVTQISQIFSAIVSNNLNIVMKILTSITVVLTIPTIIGGLYGMNVALPFEDQPTAFWVICLITVIICWISVIFLRKKKLL